MKVGRWAIWWDWGFESWGLWFGRLPQPNLDLWSVIIGPLQINRMNWSRPTLKRG